AAAHLLPPRSPYQLNAGMQIPVVLGQDLTSDAESLFSALVATDVYDSVSGRSLLVPAGSRIFGIADVDAPTNQQPTLMLAAKTLYFPNAYPLAPAAAQATNGMGIGGASVLLTRHYLNRSGARRALLDHRGDSHGDVLRTRGTLVRHTGRRCRPGNGA